MEKLAETWRGHYPITGFVLEALTKKDPAPDGIYLTRPEKVLFVACAFWAASAKGTLKQYLGRNALQRLQSATEAFNEIGALRVASILRVRVEELLRPNPPQTVARLAAEIEDQMSYVDEKVDELIAQFAGKQLPHENLP